MQLKVKTSCFFNILLCIQTLRGLKGLQVAKGRFQKKKLMEFSIKLSGWVLDAPVFHEKKTNMVLKHFILPEKHFKAN